MMVVTVAKEVPGQRFPDLDMLTKMMQPRRRRAVPTGAAESVAAPAESTPSATPSSSSSPSSPSPTARSRKPDLASNAVLSRVCFGAVTCGLPPPFSSPWRVRRAPWTTDSSCTCSTPARAPSASMAHPEASTCARGRARECALGSSTLRVGAGAWTRRTASPGA